MNFIEGELLLIDKPLTWTSFDVVNKVRYSLRRVTGDKNIKVGHAGTLDPLAGGLLLICTGKMTKRIDEFTGMDKEYTGTIFTGATTPTYDSESATDALFPTEHITGELLRQAAETLSGRQEQMPPVFSAVKVDGVASYVNARKGIKTDLKPREIFIHEFSLTSINLPHVDFRVRCSKGTYIRSLAHDFGQKLNSGAYLQSLTRTRVGEFELKNAWQLDQLIQEIFKSK